MTLPEGRTHENNTTHKISKTDFAKEPITPDDFLAWADPAGLLSGLMSECATGFGSAVSEGMSD